MPREHRITTQDFSRFFRAGKKIHSDFFLCVHAPADTVRIAVVVSKKVAKRSVHRNTMRRRVYAALHSYMHELAPGAYILMVKKPIDRLPHTELVEAVQRVLKY